MGQPMECTSTHSHSECAQNNSEPCARTHTTTPPTLHVAARTFITSNRNHRTGGRESTQLVFTTHGTYVVSLVTTPVTATVCEHPHTVNPGERAHTHLQHNTSLWCRINRNMSTRQNSEGHRGPGACTQATRRGLTGETLVDHYVPGSGTSGWPGARCRKSRNSWRLGEVPIARITDVRTVEIPSPANATSSQQP